MFFSCFFLFTNNLLHLEWGSQYSHIVLSLNVLSVLTANIGWSGRVSKRTWFPNLKGVVTEWTEQYSYLFILTTSFRYQL